nr:hypothetical protein [Chloroflexota bacterium]
MALSQGIMMQLIVTLSILTMVLCPASLPGGVKHVGAAAVPWQSTGNLRVGRMEHTATVLPDGTVLVVGGGACAPPSAPGWYCASAERYAPTSGRWSPAGQMDAARLGHTATLLATDKVLVAGGFGCPDTPVCTSAELYDPATGRWVATGGLHIGRYFHSATLLRDGTVLVAGGALCGASACASAELYDPVTGRWRTAGRLHEARFSHTATLLPSGQVLVAGGEGCRPSHLCASAELYTPATGTWHAAGSMASARAEQTATLLRDGHVLVTGGYGCLPTNVCASAELYDPATGTWHATGSMASARAGHTATLLADGDVLAVGGYGCDGHNCRHLTSAELYDPAAGRWRPAAPMRHPREYQTATLLANGTVLVAGGSVMCGTAACTASPSAELYRPGQVRPPGAAPQRYAAPAAPPPSPRCPSTPMRMGTSPQRAGMTRIWLQAQPLSSGIIGYLASDRLPHTNGWM